ncbi:beta-ketoacyl-[acyl-carrier-protein] synthase family protein [Tengunoibacter tsumagoiensis]|uniref:3-oxoacyl-[acyl-carrier-protein] synthase 2 n=1 Tax=Tengunoibacter tsumagoiensis TaxID=2014871 RepID=A0A402A7D3_9CHLR|nr:beta-ketoacyl-[acyl-carrier-protein] synthase family protein [Tengunoibacter tsumagoiensis]GCE14921.1 3-oxoacyl-[acyl-carrier-protein] synthase 2 [Tengunoibacter tsumagoiensis]
MSRVVITGIGLVTPLGVGTKETWQGLLENRSALGPIERFNATSLQTRLAGEVHDFVPQDFITNRRTLRLMTRGDQMAFAATILALRDAQLDLKAIDCEQTGIFIGSNKEVSNLDHFVPTALASSREDGTIDSERMGVHAHKVYPLIFLEGLPAASLFFISEAFGFKGCNGFFVGTADASAVAIGRAYRAIRRGETEVAIAGGFDEAVTWFNMIKLQAMEVMTEQNELGAEAYRPFDRQRSGTIIGEGAAFLVLESYESAIRRNAPIYAEIAGFGTAYDGYQLIKPHPRGRGLTLAMQAALREAEMASETIEYLSVHGSGTRLGDTSEAIAIQDTFGENASKVPGSCVKPATGHLVAAAGALNVAVSALVLRHQMLPPTLHLHEQDPECSLDLVPLQAREAHVGQALALARGLEGQNVALALRRVNEKKGSVEF